MTNLDDVLNSKEIQPSILKEISPEYSSKGLTLKRKLQHFGHLMRRADSLEKTLMLAKIEGKKKKGAAEGKMVGWHHHLNGHEIEQTPGDTGGHQSLACCGSRGCRVGHDFVTE